MASVILFMVGSLLSALAQNMTVLIMARHDRDKFQHITSHPGSRCWGHDQVTTASYVTELRICLNAIALNHSLSANDSLVSIVIVDLVPMRESPKYQGMLGGVFSISSVLGPILVSLAFAGSGKLALNCKHLTQTLLMRWIYSPRVVSLLVSNLP
ncbi:hypothetical protein BC937DRAFT_89496 [Endogone sp. FLAS-F59071]|nr:hypothetical protein BC937DRAFT_89496 [Endogone sp. FLAS-F59071]|eukprot:RUS22376.1 hypothetical protein BC937DRAFT_89496 [Endogone sp. FLAS-F59071]